MRKALILVLLTTLAACSDNADESKNATSDESASVNTPPTTVNAEQTVIDPRVDSMITAQMGCPRNGLWHVCSFENRLYQTGLQLTASDTTVYIPGIESPASYWQIGSSQTLRVVFFTNDESARNAMAGIDSARASAKGQEPSYWPDRPTIIHNANLIGLMIGGSERQIDRISNAILGGPPQPE